LIGNPAFKPQPALNCHDLVDGETRLQSMLDLVPLAGARRHAATLWCVNPACESPQENLLEPQQL
jgi:hypothetical protein